MNNFIRSTNLRFNLKKETQRRAWEYLQTMNKAEFKSYSHAISLAVVDYFNRYYKTQDDPYFETRKREERFISQIVGGVQAAMEKTLPVFLAGCLTGASTTAPVAAPTVTAVPAENAAADVDWDFLGE